ncbi:MAG: hypothetical protein KJZ83_10650 [Burkholderiaceae bacterium]|nr:hypothetical protein [Burkholderiaceae bacterium]
MHTEPSNRFVTTPLSSRTRLLRFALAALLLCAGAAHAADTQETAVAPALDLSLPRDVPAKAEPIRKPGDGRIDSKRYGSGYEARGLNASREGATSATEPASGASSGNDGTGLRGAVTGPAAKAVGGGHRSRGAGGRGRR